MLLFHDMNYFLTNKRKNQSLRAKMCICYYLVSSTITEDDNRFLSCFRCDALGKVNRQGWWRCVRLLVRVCGKHTCGSTGMCTVMSPGLPSLLLFWIVTHFNQLHVPWLLCEIDRKELKIEHSKILANVVCLYISDTTFVWKMRLWWFIFGK